MGAPSVPTVVHTQGSPSTTASNLSPSFTPPDNSLVLVMGTSRLNSETTVSMSDTFGSNLGDWEIIQGTYYDPTDVKTWVAAATANGSPGAGTVTVTYSSSVSRATFSVLTLTGHNVDNPILQYASSAGGTDTPSITLTSATGGGEASITLGVVGARGWSSGAPAGDETELTEWSSGGGSNHGTQIQHSNTATHAWTITRGGGSPNYSGIVLEIQGTADGASEYDQSMTATATGVVDLSRLLLFKRELDASLVGVGTLSKRTFFRKILTAVSSSSVDLLKLVRTLLSSNMVGVVSVNRVTAYLRTLATTVSTSVSLARVALRFVTLAAIMNGVASIRKGIEKVLDATGTGSSSIGKAIGRLLSVLVSIEASLSQSLGIAPQTGAIIAIVSSNPIFTHIVQLFGLNVSSTKITITTEKIEE